LGEALSYGWRITARCAWGKQREGLKSAEDARLERIEIVTRPTLGLGRRRHTTSFGGCP
jgi:hypothetical protein